VLYPASRAQFSNEDATWENVSPEKTLLSFDTIVKSNNNCHLVPCGKYRLDVAVAASNARLIKETFEINLRGEWYDNEAEMFGEGIGVRMVKKLTWVDALVE
jgi:hypothetical protein